MREVDPIGGTGRKDAAEPGKQTLSQPTGTNQAEQEEVVVEARPSGSRAIRRRRGSLRGDFVGAILMEQG